LDKIRLEIDAIQIENKYGWKYKNTKQ
jgi:hypothetical protein